MRRAWCVGIGWLLGCSGNHVVAGTEKTRSEQLAESLPAWCAQFCLKVDRCDPSPGCDCHGEGCGCTGFDRNQCESSCQSELGDYTGQGEDCAALGERFRDCAGALSCAELSASKANDCEPSKAERVVCPYDDPPPMIQTPPSGSGGATSFAGSAPVSYGTAGDADSGGGPNGSGGTVTIGGSGPTPPLVSCLDVGGADYAKGEPGAVVCEESRSGCSDGVEYSWVCARTASGELGCSCFVRGEFVGGFAPSVAACPPIEEVNAGCGFRLAR